MVVAPDADLPLRLITPDQRLYTLSSNGNWPRTDSKVGRGDATSADRSRPQPPARRRARPQPPRRRLCQADARAAGCGVLDAWLDLVHGGGCVGLRGARAGRCAASARTTLPAPVRPVRPTPCPDGTGRLLRRGGVRRPAARDGARPQGARRRSRSPPRSGRVLAAAAAPVLGRRRRPCSCRCRRARASCAPAGTTRCCGSPGPRPGGCGGTAAGRRSRGCSSARPRRRPGRARRRPAGGQPGRLDGGARPRRAPHSRAAGAPVSLRGLRRRADHRRHGPRGPACTRGRRAPGPGRGDGGGHAQAAAAAEVHHPLRALPLSGHAD